MNPENIKKILKLSKDGMRDISDSKATNVSKSHVQRIIKKNMELPEPPEPDQKELDKQIEELAWPIFLRKKVKEIGIFLLVILALSMSILFIFYIVDYASKYYSVDEMSNIVGIVFCFVVGTVLLGLLLYLWIEHNWTSSKEEAREILAAKE